MITVHGRISYITFDEESPEVEISTIKQSALVGYMDLGNGSILIQECGRKTLMWDFDENDPVETSISGITTGCSVPAFATQNGIAYFADYAITHVFVDEKWEKRADFPYKPRGTSTACATFIPGKSKHIRDLFVISADF